MPIGENIMKRRKARNWSQAELAEKVMTTQQMIQCVEKDVKIPGLGLAKRIADVFGCTIDDLFATDDRAC